MKTRMCLLFSLMLFSCNEKKLVNVNDAYVINLDAIPSKKGTSFSNIFKSAGCIVLEMTDKSLLAKIDKIAFIGDSLYVLERGAGVFLFDKEGKFIRKVGNKGAGLGEYVSPVDMSPDAENKKLYVLDSQTQTVLLYDAGGDYERSIKLKNKKMSCNRIQYDKGRLYTNLYTYGDAENKFLLSEVDMANGKRISFELDAAQYNKGWNELFIADQQPFISQYAGKPKFCQLFMDTIFEITQEGLQPYITFQSKDLVTKDYLDIQKETKRASKVFSDLRNTGKIYNLCNYWESDKYIYFNYYIADNIYIVFYDKQKRIASVTQDVKNDLLYAGDSEMQLFPNFIAFDKERAYSVEMNNDFTRNVLLNDVQEGRINRNIKGFDALQNLPEDANPIIVYYEFEK